MQGTGTNPTLNIQRSDVFLPLLRSGDKSLRELSLANAAVTRLTLNLIGDALRGNKTLQILDLSDNPHLTDADLEYLVCECLPDNRGLMRLNLSNNSLLTSHTIQRLLEVIRTSNDSLTVIDTEGTKIDALSAKDFADMAALNRFPSHFKQQVFRAIRNDPDLFKIELRYDKSDPKVLNEVGIATLARALSHPTTAEQEEWELMRRPRPVLCGESEEKEDAGAKGIKEEGGDLEVGSDKVDEACVDSKVKLAVSGEPLVVEPSSSVTETERITNENGHVKVRPLSQKDAKSLLKHKPLGNNTVRTLRLDNKCCRGERCVEALVPCLATNPYLAVLGLSRNDLGDESVRMLCEAICKLGSRCSLEVIDFGYNEITDEGLKIFIDCVEGNTSLKSIILTGNVHPLSPHLLQLLQQGTALNCEPSSMKVAIEKIKAGYPKNMSREDERETYVRQNCGELTDERGILRLEGTDDDKERGPSKGYFTSLGAATIAAALPTNITIHTIYFQNNHIGPEGAKALADVLEYNPTIVRIDLRNNPITDEGARKLLNALKTNDAIVTLDVSVGCQVSSRLIDEIAAVTRLNRQPSPIKEYLKMPFNACPDDVIDLRRKPVQVRGKWKSLRPESVQYVLSILAAQPKTTTLDLSDNDTLGDEGAVLLVSWLKDPRCKIRRLDLSNTSVTNIAVDAITATMRSNYSLTNVVVAGNRDVHVRARQALDEALSLNMFPAAVKDIIPLLTQDIDGINTVRFVRQPDEYYKKEAKIPVPPPLGDDTARAIFSSLMRNTHVATVILKNQQISNRGLQYACECLSVNPTIADLDLSDNMIGPDGMKDLADMLERNTTLTHIDLSGNPIGPDGASALLLAMQTSNRSLTYVNLDRCRIHESTRRQIEALAAFNTQSASFRNLVLDRISSSRTVFFRGGVDRSESHAQPTSTPMTTPKGLPHDGSSRLSESEGALNQPKSIHATSSVPDYLADDAIDALLMALDSYNKHRVRSIQLPNNHITDRGLRRLLYLLHKHPTITDIDLINNPVTDGVTREITAFLATHTHIKRFVVGNEARAVSDELSKALLFGPSHTKKENENTPKAEGEEDGRDKNNTNSKTNLSPSFIDYSTSAPTAYLSAFATSSVNLVEEPTAEGRPRSSLVERSGGGAIDRAISVSGNSNYYDLAPAALRLLTPVGSSTVAISCNVLMPYQSNSEKGGASHSTEDIVETSHDLATSATSSTTCLMSKLSLKHIRIAIALNNSSAVFRKVYTALSQQILRWGDLRGQANKARRLPYRSRGVGGAAGKGDADGGGSSQQNEGTSNTPGGEQLSTNAESKVAIGQQASAGQFYRYENNTSTIGSRVGNLPHQHERADIPHTSHEHSHQYVDAAAPEVIQFTKCDMGDAELILLMNMLVRPLEGVILDQQHMLAHGMRVPAAGGEGDETSVDGVNGKPAKDSNSSLRVNKAAVAPSAAGHVSSAVMPFTSIPPGSVVPVSPHLMTIPDGEVLRNHVRGLSLAGNADLNDHSIDMLVNDFLLPCMFLAPVSADVPLTSSQPDMVGGTGMGPSASVEEIDVSVISGEGGALVPHHAKTNAGTRGATNNKLPLRLQALVLDSCGIDGRCFVSTLKKLCEECSNLVVLGLEHTLFTDALTNLRLADEREAEEAERKRLEQMADGEVEVKYRKTANTASSARKPPSAVGGSSLGIGDQNTSARGANEGEDASAHVEVEEDMMTLLNKLNWPYKSLGDYANDDVDNSSRQGATAAPDTHLSTNVSTTAVCSTPSTLRTVLGIYSRARERIHALLASNRSRMVGRVSDELFAAHAHAQRSVLSGVSGVGVSASESRIKKNLLYLNNSSQHEAGRGVGVGFETTVDSSYGAGAASIGLGGELVYPQTAASLGATAISSAYSTHSADVVYLAANSGELSNPDTGSDPVAAALLVGGVNGPSRRLGSSLQYGRSLQEAIPVTFDDFKASEDSIFNDAIAGAPQRRLGHAEYVRNMYKGNTNTNNNASSSISAHEGASKGVVLPRSIVGDRGNGPIADDSALGVKEAELKADRSHDCQASQKKGSSGSGGGSAKALSVGEPLTTLPKTSGQRI